MAMSVYRKPTPTCCASSLGRGYPAHVADGPVRAAGGWAAVDPADPADGDAGAADRSTAGRRLKGAGSHLWPTVSSGVLRLCRQIYLADSRFTNLRSE